MATAVDETVPTAFRLGWLVGHLYHDTRHLAAHPAADPPAELPARLPDPSGLAGNGYAALQLAQIKRERDALVTAGLTLTDVSDLEAALSDSGQTGDERRGALYCLDTTWLKEIAGQRFSTARAYGLGRSLQDTTRAQISDRSVSTLFNRYRISELSSWLDDLEPDLATENIFAVKSSLHSWTRWVEQHAPGDSTDHAADAAGPDSTDAKCDSESRAGNSVAPPAPDQADAQLRGTLYRQGTIWFSLLGSGTNPSSYVIAENYVDAAKDLLQVSGELARGVGWRLWLAMLAIVLTVVALVVVATTTLNGGSQAATIVAAILAGAGLSWKAVGATVGATVKRLEHPLWEAEQRLTIAAATTRLPANDKPSGRPPKLQG